MINPEIWGIEGDWFASDLDGSIAFMSSGGSGQAPPSAIEDETLIYDLLPFFGIKSDSESWEREVECGLFPYDADI